MSLTRGQIITTGLAQANRPDLVSNARLWLNIFLERCYRDQDFEWLLKEIDNRSCVEGDTLPSDYRAMKVITATTNRLPIKIIQADEYEWVRRGVNFSQLTSNQFGTPVYAYLDLANQLIHFWPLPPVGGNAIVYNYFYYFIPTLPDPTTSGGDSSVPVWGPLSYQVLIQEIYARALEYQDDTRAAKELERGQQMLDETKRNSRDLRAGSPRFKLGKCHVRSRF
jgi:hypothetical protein